MEFHEINEILSEFKNEISDLNATIDAVRDSGSCDYESDTSNEWICGVQRSVNKLTSFVENSQRYHKEAVQLDEKMLHLITITRFTKQKVEENISSGNLIVPSDDVSSENTKKRTDDVIKEVQPKSAGASSRLGTLPKLIHLNDDEFAVIPAYMKGRLKLTNVNDFVNKFNDAVTTKYSILKKPCNQLNAMELKQYKAFKLLERKDTKGVYFITSDDLKDVVKFNNSTWSIFVILRHSGRIREIRGPKQILRYAIISLT